MNPGFLVFELDPESYAIREVHKYFMDVPESNRLNRPVWKLAHNLTSLYGLSAVVPKEVNTKVAQRLRTEEEFYHRFCHTYTSGGVAKAEEFFALGYSIDHD